MYIKEGSLEFMRNVNSFPSMDSMKVLGRVSSNLIAS